MMGACGCCEGILKTYGLIEHGCALSGDVDQNFEKGVYGYFAQFGHRQAREITQQAWLTVCLAKYISPQLVIAEFNLPVRDLAPESGLAESNGAISFDFAIARSEIDCRTWKTRTPGWGKGVSTTPQTLESLKEISVLAEMKIADSTATGTRSLERDLRKLLGAVQFLRRQGIDQLPACYLVVVDRHRKLKPQAALDAVKPDWPDTVPLPTIMIGPR